MTHEMSQRAAKIRMVMMDLDGVLTDGRIIYGDYGDELKFFDVQDGLGLTLLHEAGLRTVVISARKSRINQRRARELKIGKLYQNIHDKLKMFEKLLKKHKLQAGEICYVGDDWPDVAPMRRAGFSVAVQNAVDEVKEVAHYVAKKSGGRGAVRETADVILKAQGKRDAVAAKYFK